MSNFLALFSAHCQHTKISRCNTTTFGKIYKIRNFFVMLLVCIIQRCKLTLQHTHKVFYRKNIPAGVWAWVTRNYTLKITISLSWTCTGIFFMFVKRCGRRSKERRKWSSCTLLSESAERMVPLAEATLVMVQWRNNEHFESYPNGVNPPWEKPLGPAFGSARQSLA